jgi:hypothetical protein
VNGFDQRYAANLIEGVDDTATRFLLISGLERSQLTDTGAVPARRHLPRRHGETTDEVTVTIVIEIRLRRDKLSGGIKSRTIDDEDIEPSPSKSHRPSRSQRGPRASS